MSRKERASREELADQLEDMSHGWYRRGNDRLSEAAYEGAEQLRSGAASVKVGHTTYEVDETGDGSTS